MIQCAIFIVTCRPSCYFDRVRKSDHDRLWKIIPFCLHLQVNNYNMHWLDIMVWGGAELLMGTNFSLVLVTFSFTSAY